jgi:signal transduction histidine kinase
MMPVDDAQIDHGRIELLAIFAHELRNPLAAIELAVGVLGEQATDLSAVDQARALIKRQLRQIARLTDDLLDVARIGTGKLALRKQRIDLASVIQMAIESLRPVIDAGIYTLIVQVPSCAVYVEADPMRLAQVLINLIDNSAKYSERHGRIMVSVERDANEAVIRVRDKGIGIPADALPYVFDLFVQGEHSIEASRGGLGVGLNLVKRIVGLHSGTVEAHSDGPGAGSEFIVRVPAACN